LAMLQRVLPSCLFWLVSVMMCYFDAVFAVGETIWLEESNLGKIS